MKFFLERNSIINIALLFLSIYFGITVSSFLFLIWPLTLLADDILNYYAKFSIFNSEIRIQRGYQFGDIFTSGQVEDGRDLGFNLYDGDLNKPYKKAQTDKWDLMLKELKLKPGDWLIDIGCGYGEWIAYAKSRGINVAGVNISPEQAKRTRDHFGLDVLCANWKEILQNPAYQEKFYGKFDAVTFMDTAEHYVPARYSFDPKTSNKIYSQMFEMASHLLKKNTTSGRVFISCIHQVKRMSTLRDYLGAYLLDKYHSGSYPFGDDGLTKNAEKLFKEIARYDKTEDYRLTSVLDRRHFGALKVEWNLKRILHIPLLFILDPYHIHKWIDIKTDTWMWWHFGDDAWNRMYDNEYQKPKRRVNLWWLVLEKNQS